MTRWPLVLLAAVLGGQPLAAQTTAPKDSPMPGDGSGAATGSDNLSERLGRTGGVIVPPAGIDPEIRVPAPVPNPNTTPVLPGPLPNVPGEQPIVPPVQPK
jgi:multidrug efflux pump subunit AcrA (membrane-fusion protein)